MKRFGQTPNMTSDSRFAKRESLSSQTVLAVIQKVNSQN